MTGINLKISGWRTMKLLIFGFLLLYIPMLAAGSLPVRFTQEELLINSAGVMVKDAKHALRIVLEAYHQKKSGFSAMEGYTRPILFQLGSEIKGFAQDGDKVWEVRITSLTKDGCRTLRAIVWVHAQTGRTYFFSNL